MLVKLLSRWTQPLVLGLALAIGLGSGVLESPVRGQTDGESAISPRQLEFFEKKIRPVLVEQCYSCHSKSAKSIKGGLSLDTRDAIRAGGDSGHAVVPGDLDDSLLWDAINYESFEMPPKQQLPESVIADFKRWINMGAPDPREGPTLIKRQIDFESGKEHWAFQPMANPAPPSVQGQRWPASSIDQFILAQQESQGVQPVDDADRNTLIRRLYYDLVGLPPTPAQLSHWLQAPEDSWKADLVDELLASPHFGERWGRHWLDVVRYAESNGRERNFVFPHAWRYRDYVIDAFNHDKPFNEFIHEQLAGDLLADPQAAVDASRRNELKVATGFLAIGPKLLNEGNRNEFQMDLVDEQIDVTTRAFMGLTVSCARCHDHKFDPIPTGEYYSIAGIFRSTKTLYGTARTNGNRQPSDLLTLEPVGDQPAGNIAAARERVKELQPQLAKLQKQQQNLQRRVNDKSTSKKQVAELRKQLNQVRKRVQSLNQEVAKSQRVLGQFQAMGVADGKVGNSPIYVRGEVSNPKGTAPRGLLTILDPELEQPLLETPQSGRLELANWITDPENPLTARVQVNRIWNHLFGQGLVTSVDNFGTTGDAPTHPDLLDFLARRFQQQGWSVKSLIRELVMTRTYGLSSDHHAGNYEIDPDNHLLWRHAPKRVEAETLRDSILLASGQLDLEPGQGSPVSQLKGEYGRQTRLGDEIRENRHRSVYLPIVRNAIPEPLKLFDFAEPSILVGDRPVTTVPTQALFFLNGGFVTAQSDALAQRMLENSDLDDRQRIDRVYQRIVVRPAKPNEIDRGQKFIQQLAQRLADDKVDSEEAQQIAWSSFCQALFGSAEFRYIE